MTKALDLTGQKFNRLFAKNREKSHHGTSQWSCLCDCGNIVIVTGKYLKSGHTKSCGCYKKEMTSKMSLRVNTTHGMSNTGVYRSWSGMLARCLDKSASHFTDYGGRGISVCERWLSLNNFFLDMGHRPKGHSIDRIDNNGNYEPSNCKWSNVDSQARNKRNNIFYEFNGINMCVSDWAKKLGIGRDRLVYRLKVWPLERALTSTSARGG